MAADHHALPDDPVERALVRAAGLLPDQGPIGVFVHHNTLHAFQHLSFHEAVQAGADATGARPYLSLAQFRAALASGRIAASDLDHEIGAAVGARAAESVAPGLTRAGLWRVLLADDASGDDAAGLAFTIDAGIAVECRDPHLWRAVLARVERGPHPAPTPPRAPRRHRDVLVAHDATDPDVAVNGELIRLGSGFLDHGQAHVALPHRERGFLRAVAELYSGGALAPRDCRGVEADMRLVVDQARPPLTIIRATLAALGVHGDDAEPYLFATALALPGWAGMFSRLERHPEEHPDGPPTSLAEFLAVRLLFEHRAVARACAAAGLPLDWPALRALTPGADPVPPVHAASRLWHVARAAGWSADAVAALSDDTLAALWAECDACTDLERRRVFHEAYERTYRRSILDALAARRRLPPGVPPGRARAQFVFCIDEREESIRRAIEEQDPAYITYGAAGFFGVAIDYQGLYDREPAAHCPVVVTPGHEVYEQPVESELSWHALRTRCRDGWLAFERRSGELSRRLTGGAGLSFLLGPLTAVRTLARVLAPRSAMRMSEQVKARFAPRPVTRLSALRADTDPPPPDGGKPIGFSLAESIDRVAATLTNIGLVRDFAPMVVFLGHGSTSLNNPHESAHDCGACGGRRGGANARLFADMANRPEIRAGVAARGIVIPDDTWFVGALHDTADDSVRYFDLDAVPAGAAAAFDEASRVLEIARAENALERSRRFDDAPLQSSAAAALAHVETRSANLAQVRPEYGHCTNAICIVGRRELTRGLHFDRRAFLVSYDPVPDRTYGVLERILAAVGPVGAGISLEYYFSSVDNEVYGCGTKLPHNVTGLIGVMNGHQSDLRTGLPLQMVELHEPMRLLLVVDATPEALLAVAGRQAEVAELVVNRWVQLVSVHPETGAMAVFEDGAFVPYVPGDAPLPEVEWSRDWHLRTREFVPPALVRRGLPPPGTAAPGAGRREAVPA
ncbi:MAG: DUF2309 domain-containing protein [Vicinamibacterales bacterium]